MLKQRWFAIVGGVALAGFVGAAALAQETDRRRDPGDRSRGEEEQIRQREEWFIAQRGLDQIDRPELLRAEALEEARVAMAAVEGDGLVDDGLVDSGLVAGSWSVVGPSPMNMQSWVMGKVAGRVSALAVHPSDENVLYLGTASGGLWKTTNGGTGWSSIFDATGTQTIGSLAIDPNNANTVWVGTGEQRQSCSSYFGLGLFRSTDGGATFAARNGSGSTALDLSYVTAVAVQPGNVTIRKGADQWITATTRGFDASRVRLFVRPEEASEWEAIPMSQQANLATYEFLLAAIRKPVEYYVEADARAPWSIAFKRWLCRKSKSCASNTSTRSGWPFPPPSRKTPAMWRAWAAPRQPSPWIQTCPLA
ncbi:MAG: hypothetical protein HC834_09795, partial [Rhodospirillales bacterium]|nr:hypothetical protein [Rhodospirillales bacterium]